MDTKNNIIHIDNLDIWNNESNIGPGVDSLRRVHTPAHGGGTEGMDPESNTLREQHTPSACDGVVDFRSHVHGEYEIIYVFSGDVEFYLEAYKYPLGAESLFLVPANSFHGWKPLSSRLYHRVSVLFMPELFEPAEQSLFLTLFNTGNQFFPHTSSRNINFYINALLECKTMEPPLQKIALKSRLVSLLSEITLLHSKYAREPAFNDKRVFEVLKYLEAHLRDELGLEDIARRFSISKNYLNLLFRQTTGTTVNHYIRAKRLGLARQEILAGADMQEAAYRVGFNDYSNFYRAYKSFYGSMPSALNKNLPQKNLSTPVQ